MATHAIPLSRIQQKIFIIRGQKVMLDMALAELYGVSTKRLNEQVKRNRDRFPGDCVPRTYDEGRCNLPSMVLCKR